MGFIELTDENFDEEVLTSTVPVLVDFWGDGCPPCKLLAPVLEELAQVYKGRIKVGKALVNAAPIQAKNFRVMAVPTLVFFKEGKEVNRILGFTGKEALERALDNLL